LPSAIRRVSRSETAIIRTPPHVRIPGTSMPLAIRPKPICPTWIVLLGAACPSTRAGMIDGKAAAHTPAAPVLIAVLRVICCIVSLLVSVNVFLSKKPG